MSTERTRERDSELAKVRERISELSAEFDRAVETSPDFLRAMGLSPAGDGAREHVLAQARVELAVYTGAMKSVGALFQRAVGTGDFTLADHASKVMQAMEESFALARATVDELQREDTDGV